MNTAIDVVKMLGSDAVLQRFEKLNVHWDFFPLTGYNSDLNGSLELLLTGLHSCNSFSWRMDDLSRGNFADDILMDYKRKLDASNLMRSSFMEQIDAKIVSTFKLSLQDRFEEFEVNSETIGQIIDRLSVLSLKKHNVLDQLSSEAMADAEAMLANQLLYVSHCLDRFLNNLASGKGYMLAYKQYKTYRGG